MNWIFFGPAMLVAWYAYAGFAIGAALLGGSALHFLTAGLPLDRNWFRQPAVLGGLLWGLFNLYELQVAAVFAAPKGQAPNFVRIDLLVLSPILYTLTALAIYRAAKNVFSRSTG